MLVDDEHEVGSDSATEGFALRRPPVVGRAVVSPEKAAMARKLRREATASEQEAWEFLRGRRCLGLKFRRQQVIRGFIVDFYCAEHRLAIELDGGVHDGQGEQDAARDQALREMEVRVVRLRNEDLSPEALHEVISRAIA